VETRVGEAQRQFPAFRDRLVLMLDMTVYPPEVPVHPVRKLEQSLGMTTYGPKHETTHHRRDTCFRWSSFKVHVRNTKFTLFIPSTVLRMAFEDQYFPNDEAHDSAGEDDVNDPKHEDDSVLLDDTDVRMSGVRFNSRYGMFLINLFGCLLALLCTGLWVD
jgi:hypothetical protein